MGLLFSYLWISSEHKFHENCGDTVSRNRIRDVVGHGRHVAVGMGQWGVGDDPTAQSLKVGPFREKLKGEASGQASVCPWTGLKHQHSGPEAVATGLFVCSHTPCSLLTNPAAGVRSERGRIPLLGHTGPLPSYRQSHKPPEQGAELGQHQRLLRATQRGL